MVVRADNNGISIDENTFPDPEFRQYISYIVDVNGDGVLSDPEIENVKEIDVSSLESRMDPYWGIRGLVGIEYFKELEVLNCENNMIQSLDLCGNTRLKALNCSRNKLNSLDISQCIVLETIDCCGNELHEHHYQSD